MSSNINETQSNDMIKELDDITLKINKVKNEVLAFGKKAKELNETEKTDIEIAIDWLKDDISKLPDTPVLRNSHKEALEMAINALKYDDIKYHNEHNEVIVDCDVWEDAKKALKAIDSTKTEIVMKAKEYDIPNEDHDNEDYNKDYNKGVLVGLSLALEMINKI